jgi:hypothetical protein
MAFSYTSYHFIRLFYTEACADDGTMLQQLNSPHSSAHLCGLSANAVRLLQHCHSLSADLIDVLVAAEPEHDFGIREEHAA